ncbi:MAG: bifunctional [glutamate--ammonia ligase]-adenylyl-L-tyrosine phosphorylase/[glutamate--ammonia-ligase] adenylyltransferase, partial [Candidatus Helarchaeota archaeon]|nr:bifunctional [glutamate--ammonia ligase]-adenylyl-L-tyrosine phosphorylase/[glutamate--ammonia-ligase] adenylyltransferase [Candidatus Helarchaeota archaeon]
SQIMHVRERIENELAEEDEFKKDFKLGYGGIVDIEFIIQILQLKYGGKFRELRIPNTLKALNVLENKGILDKANAGSILSAYKFLRRIENRLRIMHDTSLHSFNVTEEEIESLALRMKYVKEKGKKAGEALLGEYKGHTENIRKIYKRIFKKLLSEKD